MHRRNRCKRGSCISGRNRSKRGSRISGRKVVKGIERRFVSSCGARPVKWRVSVGWGLRQMSRWDGRIRVLSGNRHWVMGVMMNHVHFFGRRDGCRFGREGVGFGLRLFLRVVALHRQLIVASRQFLPVDFWENQWKLEERRKL